MENYTTAYIDVTRKPFFIIILIVFLNFTYLTQVEIDILWFRLCRAELKPCSHLSRTSPNPRICLYSTEVKLRAVSDWTGQTTAQLPNKKTWRARSQWRIRATKADDGYAKQLKQAPGLVLTAAFFSNIFTFSAQMEIRIWHRGGKQALLEKNTADWALVSSDYRFYISATRKRERLALSARSSAARRSKSWGILHCNSFISMLITSIQKGKYPEIPSIVSGGNRKQKRNPSARLCRGLLVPPSCQIWNSISNIQTVFEWAAEWRANIC